MIYKVIVFSQAAAWSWLLIGEVEWHLYCNNADIEKRYKDIG